MTKQTRRSRTASFALLCTLIAAPTLALAWDQKVLTSDPLLRMPGTQPDPGLALEPASACTSCHSGFNPYIEPMFLWKGSMMAQSARDPLFWSAMTVAAQDSIWALGNPNAADLCERCHLPKGWAELRSDPPNALAMNGSDFDGVQCDFCHRMVDPFFEDSHSGVRESNDWLGYWDETNTSMTPSQSAADKTYSEDIAQSSQFVMFNGNPLYGADNRPKGAAYNENASGQYYLSKNNQKRAGFSDASALHQMAYSRYHKSKYYCSTCHDVSNPALANLMFKDTPPLDGTTVLPTEDQSAHSYFHVERTFSEFMLSDYGLEGGSPGTGFYDPAKFKTSRPGNAIATCQDCHMPDSEGPAANVFTALNRPSASTEHPTSGQPIHDLTGGNAFIPYLLASAIKNSPNYDPKNEELLVTQGPALLTLNMKAGLGVDPVALLAGRNRALAQLSQAATIDNLSYDRMSGSLSFRVQNHTGHKLISGYPEGRRMFVNIRLYAQGSLLHEVNPYDQNIGTLKGLDPVYSPQSPALMASESHDDSLVYEVHMQSSLTGEAHTFHFVLGTGRAKDNRIPPKGFRIAEAPGRLADPVSLGVSDPNLFSAAEYAGGYDEIARSLPAGADAVEVRLFYQTTSREYIEFLRDEINGIGNTLSSPTPSGEANAYVVQTDPFFLQLKKWGDTIWELWDHNKNIEGAAPVLMTKAYLIALDTCTVGMPPNGTPCDDGNACTTMDTCNAGACSGGPALSCDDQNDCTDDTCDPILGCVHTPNKTKCDDKNPCTENDACAFGVCVGSSLYCGDGNACTTDTCDPASGCVFTPIPDCPMGTGGAGGQAGAGAQGGQGGTGAQGGAGGQTSSSSSSSGSPAPPTDDGCGCTIPGDNSTGFEYHKIALAALAIGIARARRRRSHLPH